MLVAVQSRDQVAVIDPRGQQVVRRVRLGAGVMPHAHAVAVDPRTYLVYLPLEREAGRPVLRVMAPTPGPGEGVTGNGRAMLAMQWRSPGPVASLERCAAAR